jgi:hypothetical protein
MVYGGFIYTSTDYGVTWVATSQSASFFRAVAISADGKYQTAGDRFGKLYTSATEKSNFYGTVTAPIFTGASTTATSTFAGGFSAAGVPGLTVLQSGNVGIGTSSPFAKLSVAGLIVGQSFVGTSTATSTFGGGLDIASGCFAIAGTCIGTSPSQWTTSGSNIYYNVAGGNVGIGTTSPFAKLSVAGSVVAQDFTATSTTSTSTFSGGLVVGNNALNILQNGNVGIGTTSPFTKLSVAGEVLAAYFTATTSTATSTFGGLVAGGATGLTVLQGGSVGIGTNTPSAKLAISGGNLVIANGLVPSLSLWASTGTGGHNYRILSGESSVPSLAGSLAILDDSSSGAVRMVINSSGNVGIGTTSPYSLLSVAGQVVAQNYIATSTTSTSTFSGGLVVGNNAFNILQNGNVGIGTSSPYALLSVAGTIVGAKFIGTTTATSTLGGGLDIASGCFAISGTCIGTSSSQWITTGSSIYYNVGGGNVGIGTTSPIAKLSVAGEALAAYFTATTTTATSTFLGGFIAAGANGLTVLQGGNVGIGTTSPYAKFSVAGTVVGQNFVGTSTATSTFGGGLDIASGCFAISGNCLTSSQWTTTGSSIYYNVAGGNVGIGTTSPIAKLSVAGEVLAAYFTATTTTATSTFLGGFIAAGANGLTVLQNGSVGIGTTSPFAKLSVAGLVVGQNFNATSTTSTSTFAGGFAVGTNAFTVLQNGNVGAGTSSPYARFSIGASSGQTNDLFAVASSSGAIPPYTRITANGETLLTGRAVDPVFLAETLGTTPGTTLDGAWDVFVSGKYAYMANPRRDSLAVIDISNPANPTYLAETRGPTPGTSLDGANGLFVSGKYAYVATQGRHSLAVIDISNPASPTFIAETQGPVPGTSLSFAQHVFVSGNYAYVTTVGNASLAVIDVSNPSNPTFVAQTQGSVPGTTLDNPDEVFVSGKYAYVTSYGNDSLVVIDISNPLNPTVVGETQGPTPGTSLDGARGLYVLGKYAYVTNTSRDSLAIINISDPTSPTFVAETRGPTPGTSLDLADDVFVSGKYAYVTTFFRSSVAVIDISNPATPTFIAETQGSSPGTTLFGAGGIFVSGKYAYVAVNDRDSLAVIDIGGATLSNVAAGSLDLDNIQVNGLAQFDAGISTKGGLVAGNAILANGGLSVMGNFIVSSSTATSTLAGGLAVGSNAFNVLQNGNVGIGTSSPYAKLSVAGQVVGEYFTATSTTATSTFGKLFASQDVRFSSLVGCDTIDTDSGGFLKCGTDAGGGTGSPVGPEGAVQFNTSGSFNGVADFTWDNSTKRLGIGTSSPYAKLSVAGSIVGQDFTATSTTSTSTFAGGLVVGSNAFNILQGGNVGIGTSSPYAKLSVAGEVVGSIFTATTTTATSTFAGGFVAAGINGLTVLQSGRVGIGTTSPYAKLSVVGEVVSEFFSATSTTATSTFSGGFSVAGSPGFRVLQDGRVGIGTSTPNAKLTISDVTQTNDLLTINASSTPSSIGGAYIKVSNLGLTTLTGKALNPEFLGETQGTVAGTTLDGAVDVYVSGKYAYLTSLTSDSFSVIDISNPASPTYLAQTQGPTPNTSLDGAGGVFVAGKYAYVANSQRDSLAVIDISNPLNPTFIAETRGTTPGTTLDNANSVYVSGKYAYVTNATRASLAVIDISNPTNPTFIAETRGPTPGTSLLGAVSVTVVGNYAYVACSNRDSLAVIDISNPSNPTFIAETQGTVPGTTLDGAQGVYVSGKYAFVATANRSSLAAIDISNPASPTFVSEVRTISTANQVSISGKYAYVTSGGSDALYTVDISTPSSMKIIGVTQGTTPGTSLDGAYGIFVSGRYVYVANNLRDSLAVVDVGGLEVPNANIGSLYLDNLNVGSNAQINQSLSILGGLDVGGGIYSSGPLSVYLSSTTQSSPISAYFEGLVGIGTTSPMAKLSVAGETLAAYFTATTSTATSTFSGGFIAAGANGLTVLQSGNVGIGTSSPYAKLSVAGEVVGSIFTATTTTATSTFAGGFVAAGINGLTVLQSGRVGIGTTSPYAKLSVAGSIVGQDFTATSTTSTSTFAGGLAVGTNALNILQSGNIGIGTSSPSSKLTLVGGNFTHTASGTPTTVSSVTLTGIQSIYISGKYAYVGGTTDLKIVDISSSTPVIIGAVTLADPNRIFVSGKYAYVADSTSGLRIVDISKPSAPLLISTFASTQAQDIYVSGKYAYLADQSGGLKIIDISTPALPTLAGTYTSGVTNASAIYVTGKYAYLGDLGGGVGVGSMKILDISNPASPTLVGTGATEGNPLKIQVSGRYAYIGHLAGNFSIVDISNPSSPVSIKAPVGSTQVNSLFISGKYLYTADGGTLGTDVYDVSNPVVPSLIGTNSGPNTSSDIFVSGKYAYVAGFNALFVIDINGMETPSIYTGNIAVNTINISDNITVGNNLYVQNGINVGLGGIYSDANISGSYFNAASTTATSTFSGGFTAAGATGLTVLQNSNVGVGTTSSLTAKFTIAGSVSSPTMQLFEVSSSTGASLFHVMSTGNVGISSSTPFGKLTVIGGTNEQSPSFIVATTSTWNSLQAPLIFAIATTTGAMDYARIGIGATSTQGLGGLRDQLTVAGRIYSTWKYDSCDFFSSNIISATLGADTSSVCGPFAYNFATDSSLVIQTTGYPSFARLRVGITTSGLVGEAGAVRTWNTFAPASTSPVLEAGIRIPTVSTGGTLMYLVGFTDIPASTTTPQFLPVNGVYFAATSTNNWIAIVRSNNIENRVDTGISTTTFRTNFHTMRVEVSSSTNIFLIDGAVVATISPAAAPRNQMAAMARMSVIANTVTAATSDMDISYMRLWVDDPPGAGGNTEIAKTAFDPARGADIAEAYLATDKEKLIPGTLLALDEAGGVKVRETRTRYDKNLIGVITTSPDRVMGVSTEETVSVALTGRVPVAVNLEGGPILTGDYLTSSSIPGQAMKATKAGSIVGRALEAFSGTSTDPNSVLDPADPDAPKIAKILVYIAPGTFNGDLGVDSNATSTTLLQKLLTANSGLPEGLTLNTAADFSSMVADRVVALNEIIAPVITTDNLQTNKISNQDGLNVLSFDEKGNAVFLGDILASHISAKHIDGIEVLTDSIDALAKKLANVESALASASSTAFALSNLTSASSTLLVSHKTLMDGLEVNKIGKAGDIFGFDSDIFFIGRPYFTTDTAGFAVVKKGDKRVEITFDRPYIEKPIINATMMLDTSGNSVQFAEEEETFFANDVKYAISQASTTGFTIVLNKPADQDITFNWTALAVRNAKSLLQSLKHRYQMSLPTTVVETSTGSVYNNNNLDG